MCGEVASEGHGCEGADTLQAEFQTQVLKMREKTMSKMGQS